MRKTRMLVFAVLVCAALAVQPANAITFGQPDGNRHPNVGALVAEWMRPGIKDIFCSGTLIAPRVVLTAAHCPFVLEVVFGVPPDQIWVTFDTNYVPGSSPIIHGVAHSDPLFGHGQADPHDIAVVLLDESVGAVPARLPTADLLGQLHASGSLRSQTFTAVGYGTVRETKRTGPHGLIPPDGIRRFVLQKFSHISKSWITYSQNPSKETGGTCFGDSGGPHFLGGVESNLLASITITGDAVCRSVDKTYRLDTPAARAFLAGFVTPP